jgi:hypothetical protein
LFYLIQVKIDAFEIVGADLQKKVFLIASDFEDVIEEGMELCKDRHLIFQGDYLPGIDSDHLDNRKGDKQ